VTSRIITVRQPETQVWARDPERLSKSLGAAIPILDQIDVEVCSGPRPKSRVRRRGRAAAAKVCALRVSPGRTLRPVIENPALERAVKNSPRPW